MRRMAILWWLFLSTTYDYLSIPSLQIKSQQNSSKGCLVSAGWDNCEQFTCIYSPVNRIISQYINLGARWHSMAGTFSRSVPVHLVEGKGLSWQDKNFGRIASKYWMRNLCIPRLHLEKSDDKHQMTTTLHKKWQLPFMLCYEYMLILLYNGNTFCMYCKFPLFHH